MLTRWIKFNAAGILGVAVQLGTLQLLTKFSGLNYLFATSIAVEIAVVHNFLWHEKYTWCLRTRIAPRDALRRLLNFNLSNGAVSLVGNVVLMKVLVAYGHVPLLAANLCAIAACSTLNFAIAEFVVFAVKGDADDTGLFV